MPSPNVVQKSSTKKTPEQKGAELGQKLAKKRSQDFKSKIEGWNGTGAGVATEQDEVIVVVEEVKKKTTEKAAPAAVVVVEKKSEKKKAKKDTDAEDQPEDVNETSPKTPVAGAKAADKQTTQRKTSREIDTEKKAWVRRKSKPAVELSAEVKQVTTPKKRVVSDGHWRRDKLKKDETSPEKDKENEAKEKGTKEKGTKEKETTPKPVIIRRSVVSIGVKSPPSTQEFVELAEGPSKKKVPRRSRSHNRGDERAGTPDYESPGTKVFVKRRKRSRTAEGRGKDGKGPSTSESSFTAASSVERPSSSTDITVPDLTPIKTPIPRPSTAPKERVVSKLVDDIQARNRSADAEELPRRVSRAKAGQSSPKEDGKADRSRILSNKPHTPIPKVFGNRIEGWLANMPEDPFSLPSEPSIVSDGPRSKTKRRENLDDDYDNGRRRSSGRIRQSRPSLEPIDSNERSQGPSKWTSIDDWVEEATPTNLKRSGARRNTQSPVKDRSMRAASTNLDENTSPAGLPRTDSRRFTYNGLQGARYAENRPRMPTYTSNGNLQPRGLHSDQQLSIIEGSTLSRASDGDEPIRDGNGLRRRLTKHSDLMSVLSHDDKTGPNRTSRSRRLRNESMTIADLMNEITTDELKYQRELRTLVDGVIPVLLTYVISKSDAARPTGSRKSSLHDNPALTQPIYDMGVSLERLKTSHKRIPMHDANELLIWAQSTAKLYSEYMKAWRLGFEDVVANLAPADETGGAAQKDEGERVDVAYLLKRPLVRVKNLSRTLKAISQIKPSRLADDLTLTYQDLVSEARRRANDERARLEDEAAAAIDPTRARDPRNLVQLNGVIIDPSRSVGARDYFDMELFHSSGQQLGCKVELIRRDNPLNVPGPGDVLFCEVSSSGRWLLFPPILASYVTARKGDKDGEVIVMVRGSSPSGGEWREVMSLQSTEDQSAEWIEMLGSDPMPPRLTRQSSFNALRGSSKSYVAPPSPTESVVPIGERATPSAPRWDGSDVNSNIGTALPARARGVKPTRYYSGGPSPYGKTGTIAEEQYNSADNQKRSRYHHVRSKTEWTSDHEASRQKNDYNVWLPSSDRDSEESADEEDRPARRPTLRRRTSSVPSQGMPTIPKLRQSEQAESTPKSKLVSADPSSAPAKNQKQRAPGEDKLKSTSTPPKAPPHSSRPTSLGLRPGALPSFTPAFLKKHRRSSSPLKHEYEPSTATESSSDSDLSDDDDVLSVTSHSTVDDNISTIGELKDFSRHGPVRPPPPRSMASVDQQTLRPSDSPSQAPYRGVPPSTNGSAKSIACILSWNDRGTWDTMHPEECEIVVTPGLIEAFDLAQAHAVMGKMDDLGGPSPSSYGVKPLVALELTPLVPLRRGTALDISIRSPPTGNSVLRSSNNIMYRSRSPEECERLYNMINRARIDNPTWIALQNARGPMPTSNWGEAMDKRNAARSNGSPSWMKSLSRKGSTYRSKGARSASIAASQSSVGTMNSAMSALRKFSGSSSRIFNIAKSTIVSREGTRSSGSDSLDSGAGTPVPHFDINMGTPLGITGTKCRFYSREDQTRWRDMGSARLTIMLPPRPDPSVPADPSTTGVTKRVLVTGKSRGETLLDVTLEENCFERTGRTGIMVSVWRELIGPNGEMGRAAATGGVGTTQTRKFMIQLKSERDAAFTFGMVGKLRY